MTSKTLWCCEHCDYQSTDHLAVMKHEAAHFNLTLHEYATWHSLSNAARQAGLQVGLHKNPQTDRVFHEAITALVEFEKEHHLTIRPHHFLY